jgi:hypothetical protein
MADVAPQQEKAGTEEQLLKRLLISVIIACLAAGLVAALLARRAELNDERDRQRQF